MGFACVSLSLRSLLWTANMVGEVMCLRQLFRLVVSVQGVVNRLSINNMSWEIRWLIPFVLLSATHRIWGAKTLTITSKVICHCCILHDLKMHCMLTNLREPSRLGQRQTFNVTFCWMSGKKRECVNISCRRMNMKATCYFKESMMSHLWEFVPQVG